MPIDPPSEAIPVEVPTIPAVMVAAVAVAASLGVAVRLLQRRRSSGAWLPRRPHPPIPWEGIDVAFVLTLYLASAALTGAALPPEPTLPQMLLANLVTLALTTLGATVHLWRRGAGCRDLGWSLGPDGWRGELRLALGGLALVTAPLLGLATVLDTIVPYRHPLVDLLLVDRSPATLAVVIISAVVAAPIAEEFFFRRVLQGWLEKRLPAADAAGAVAVSALCFAAAHTGQGLAAVPLFLLGAVLGKIARCTGSIIACTVLHALFNAVSVAIVLLTTQPPS